MRVLGDLDDMGDSVIGALLGLAATGSAMRGLLGDAAQSESAHASGHVRTQVPLLLRRSLAYGVGTLAAYWCIERAWLLG